MVFVAISNLILSASQLVPNPKLVPNPGFSITLFLFPIKCPSLFREAAAGTAVLKLVLVNVAAGGLPGVGLKREGDLIEPKF
jgi:hypothetical protein